MKRVLREAVHVGVLIAFVAGALWLYVLTPGFRLDLPIAYGPGDSLDEAHTVKLTIEKHWFPFHSDNLGAPFGSDQYDMPLAQWLDYGLLNLIGLFSSDWAVVGNVFVLSGFFLAAISAYGLFRWMRLEPAWSMLGGIVFAFQPYHFVRLLPPFSHTFLASYWNIPAAIWLALWSWRPDLPRLSPPMSLALAGSIVAVAAGNIYYAYFACFLIAVAGAASAVAHRNWRLAIPAAACVLAIALVVAVQLAPSVVHSLRNGENTEAGRRYPSESELYALKPIQLLIPQPMHRLSLARDLAGHYNGTTPLVSDNRAASLGVFASAGFVLLLGVALRRFLAPRGDLGMFDKLAFLTVAALSLATVGGVGAVAAWTLTTRIRGYNRMSIFIACLSIAALLLIGDALSRSIRSAQKRRVIQALAAGALAVVALWDQTVPFDQRQLQESFQSDRNFVRRVEAALPARTAVYQLPYSQYPEAAGVNKMRSYDLFRGYLHSRDLRWSYGGMKGRPSDRWLQTLSKKPLEEQLTAAAEAGFGAVYVDRRGYSDQGQAIESTLRARLGPPLATDDAGNLAVYRLVLGSTASATDAPAGTHESPARNVAGSPD